MSAGLNWMFSHLTNATTFVFECLSVYAIALLLTSILAAVPPSRFHKADASAHMNSEAGAVLFSETGCGHCHGSNGVGSNRGPDLSTVGSRRSRQRIEQQIRKGGNGMPPFGDILAPDQVTVLVNFLAGKRKNGPVRRGSAPRNFLK